MYKARYRGSCECALKQDCKTELKDSTGCLFLHYPQNDKNC